MTLNELILKKIEETIELNTDSVIGEDGTIVCDYAQLRGALMGMFTTALRNYRREDESVIKQRLHRDRSC